MIGNDIIDINETKLTTNWTRKGFLQKIFTSEEQVLIKNAVVPFDTVWRLWSMKESAYKLYMQMGAARFFNPTKLSCKILSPQEGIIQIEQEIIKTKTVNDSNYIFTNAAIEDLNKIVSNIFYLPSNKSHLQSKRTHQKIVDFIADKYQLDRAELELKKTKTNIPKIYFQDKKLKLSFSLTHHGNFGAFSILKT